MSLTKEIQTTICKAEIQKGNNVAENFNYFFAGELDVISVNKSCYVNEFEVKVSRADFKADAKKGKWWTYNAALNGSAVAMPYAPNYFTYVCPEGLIKEDDLKTYQGLIYIVDGQPVVIRKPKLIHKHKHDIVKLLTKMLTVNNWKAYYGAQRLTILNREAKEKNDTEARQKLVSAFSHIQHRNNQHACFLNCQGCEKCELQLQK